MDESGALEILHSLRRKSPGKRHAFVVAGERIYFAREADDPVPGSSPVVKLLQGIFEEHRDLSFFILRKRLWLSYPAGPMDRGFVDLVAKRMTSLEADVEPAAAPPEDPPGPSIPNSVGGIGHPVWIEVGREDEPFPPLQDRTQDLRFAVAHIRSPGEALSALADLEAQVRRGSVLHDHARPIAAVLVDGDGRVLGHSVHGGIVNKTLHAEVILLQNLLMAGARFDANGTYRLYVSLSPCRMCAGILFEVFGESLEVHYRELDEGRQARLTALTERSRQWPLGR